MARTISIHDFVQNKHTGRVGLVLRLTQDGRWLVDYTTIDELLLAREREEDLINLEEGK